MTQKQHGETQIQLFFFEQHVSHQLELRTFTESTKKAVVVSVLFCAVSASSVFPPLFLTLNCATPQQCR